MTITDRADDIAKAMSNEELADDLVRNWSSHGQVSKAVRFEAALRLRMLAQIGPS